MKTVNTTHIVGGVLLRQLKNGIVQVYLVQRSNENNALREHWTLPGGKIQSRNIDKASELENKLEAKIGYRPRFPEFIHEIKTIDEDNEFIRHHFSYLVPLNISTHLTTEYLRGSWKKIEAFRNPRLKLMPGVREAVIEAAQRLEKHNQYLDELFDLALLSKTREGHHPFYTAASLVSPDGKTIIKAFKGETIPTISTKETLEHHAEEILLKKFNTRLAKGNLPLKGWTLYTLMEPCSSRDTPGHTPCSILIA